MKKLILAAAALAAMFTAQAAPSLAITFNGEDNAGITFGQNSSVTYADGHAIVEMGAQSTNAETGEITKWRADMIYNAPAESEGFSFDPATDKIIAVKFIGSRPQGAMKMEVNKNGTGTYYKNDSGPTGTITTESGNKIYYYDLTAISGYSDAEPFISKFFQFKIADNTAAPHAYTVDWIKVYESVEALEADKNWKDDGAAEMDDLLPITNITSGVDYSTLADALNKDKGNVHDNDVIVINRDITLPDRLSVPCKLTIRGASPEVRIHRNFDKIMLLVNSETTFENITLSSKDNVQGTVYLEVNNVPLRLNNVVIKSAKTSNAEGLINLKGGHLYANGLTFDADCSSTNEACPGFIYLRDNKTVELDGVNNNVSVTINNAANSISVGENFSVGSTPVKISYKNAPAVGNTIVKGTENYKLFELVASSGYDATGFLAPGDKTVVLSDTEYVYPIVNLNTNAEYKNFDDAVTAAEADDVLLINSDILLKDRVTLTKPLTFRGATQDVCIKRDFTNKIMLIANANTTFENITLTSRTDEMEFVLLEINKATVRLNDVIVRGVNSKKDQGIIGLRDGGRIETNNVTFLDCSSTHASCPGFIFLGHSCIAKLDGENNNVSVTIENTNGAVTVGDNFSVNTPVGLSVKYSDIKLGETKVVRDFDDASFFTLVNLDGHKLSSADGHLVLDGAYALHFDFWGEATGWDEVYALLANEEKQVVVALEKTTPARARSAEDYIWKFKGNTTVEPTSITFMNMADPDAEDCQKTTVCDFQNIVGYEPVEGATPGEYALQVKEGTTGIEAIDADALEVVAPAEYFDLTGRRVAAPAPGHLYIVRQGSKVAKVRL